jgi:predicted hotdog family 3-hydroxylacyl-ACP dehydratase
MLIDRAAIARMIPHAADMCLLDAVIDWDGTRIACRAETHRAPDNPLRREGRLGILCGIEYAAQAMAVHGALCDADTIEPPRAGFLASLRDVSWHAARLDLLAGPLMVTAERLHGEAGRMIYGFALHHADRLLLDGRAAVVLAAQVA